MLSWICICHPVQMLHGLQVLHQVLRLFCCEFIGCRFRKVYFLKWRHESWVKFCSHFVNNHRLIHVVLFYLLLWLKEKHLLPLIKIRRTCSVDRNYRHLDLVSFRLNLFDIPDLRSFDLSRILMKDSTILIDHTLLLIMRWGLLFFFRQSIILCKELRI